MDRPVRSRRWRTAALTVLAIVAAYALVVGVAVPAIAKKLIADKGGEKLGRVVVLDELRFNPFTLDATARGLRILEADRATTFVSFETLDIAGSVTSLYRFAPVADAVTLTGLKVNLVRDGETHYNVSDVLQRLAAKPAAPGKDPGQPNEDEDPARFSLGNVRLVNARIDFDDRPMGRKHEVTELNVAVPFISSLPRHLKEFVQPSFAANVNGSPLKVTGETLPFEDSLQTRVSLDLDALDLARYVAYSPVPLPVKVESGKLDANIKVRFTQSGRKDPTVDVAGKLLVTGLGVADAAGGALAKVGAIEADIASFDPIAGLAKITALTVKDVIGLGGEALLPATEVKNIQVDLKKKALQVETIASSGGVVNVKRTREAGIELPSIALAAPSEPSPGPPWNATLAKLTLEGFKVNVADTSVKPALTHRVQVASLEASEITTANGVKGALAAKLGFDKGGSVELAGTFVAEPLVLNARVDARRIDLVGLRPYIEQFPSVALKSGNASAKGTVVLRGKGEALQVSYNGGAEIANLGTVDTINKEDLLNWRSVRTTGVDFAYAPNAPLTLSVAEIVVDKVYSRLILDADGKLNVQQLRTATPAQPAGAAPAAGTTPRNVRIDRITFVDGRLNFTDLFIRPNYSADVGGLQGSVTNLSSDPRSRATVDLRGSYGEAAPVLIAGTVNPLGGELFVDIAAKGQGIELPTLTAYSQRYAGYGITAGKLTLDVKYHIENGKLDGRNRILIERLTFGDKVESPEATKLPVLFAVNLLKDASGEIQLELPITGSLADPQFNIGALIAQVLGNLLKKAVTAPFSLLAAAFGGSGGSSNGSGQGGDDLGYVEFDPGASALSAPGTQKLDTLTKALQGRPGLTLTMAARIDPEADAKALRQAAWRARLLAAKGGNATAIDDAEYPALVRKIYAAEKLPPIVPLAGVDRAPSVAEMEAALLEKMPAGEEALRALSAKRAEQVRSYLVTKGQLPENRVLVAASPGESEGVKARLSRVDFSLQ